VTLAPTTAVTEVIAAVVVAREGKDLAAAAGAGFLAVGRGGAGCFSSSSLCMYFEKAAGFFVVIGAPHFL
jgi:hypothetical protein